MNPISTVPSYSTENNLISSHVPLPIEEVKKKLSEWKKMLNHDPISLPFPMLHITDEDINEGRSSKLDPHFKYQTPHYIAYVPVSFLPYITPEHLYQEEESFAMKEARRYIWGHMSGIECYQIEHQYPIEVSQVNDEWHALLSKDINDKEKGMETIS